MHDLNTHMQQQQTNMLREAWPGLKQSHLAISSVSYYNRRQLQQISTCFTITTIKSATADQSVAEGVARSGAVTCSHQLCPVFQQQQLQQINTGLYHTPVKSAKEN